MVKNQIFLQDARFKLRNYLVDGYSASLKAVVDSFSLAFQMTWQGWCEGEKPRSIRIDNSDINFDPCFVNYSDVIQ